ncbi:MAG: hypothetical protein LBL74_05660 [Bacteroidales bacterium]|jgi:hypothetical protein|nr:hypothetical protein [Bacteroidales bacterium]
MIDTHILNTTKPVISSDIVFAWIASWANNSYKLSHPEMNMLAKKVIKLVVQRKMPDFHDEIKDVNAVCNYGDLNVMCQVNKRLNIITLNHPCGSEDEKLELCKNLMSMYDYRTTGKPLVAVYYAHEKESKEFIAKVKDLDWGVITKSEIMAFLSVNKEVIMDNIFDVIFDD